jgi:hypothetical protein
MTLLIPARLVRLAFFTLSAGCAGLLSAEWTALTLAILVLLAASCRGPIRLELVLAGMTALAARYSEGNWEKFKAVFLIILPLVIAMAGLYVMSRTVFGPRNFRNPYRRYHRW